jgi:GxxExxY protein
MPAESLIVASEGVITKTLDCAFEVHRHFGPGLLESIYERALSLELTGQSFEVSTQVSIPVFYKGSELGVGFRADFLVEQQLLLEIKTVDSILPIHIAQVITYLFWLVGSDS